MTPRIPLLDLDLLARLIKRVTYGGSETLGNASRDADEIAAEYARLASESSTPPCDDAAGHYATLCDCFSAALPVKEREPHDR